MRRPLVTSFAAAIVLALILVQVLEPSRLDMRPNYEHDASDPYGSRILFEILPELMDGAEVRINRRSAYLHLRDTTRVGETYFILTSFFAPDSLLSNQLLAFAARGNTVFAAVEDLFGPLADSLSLRTSWTTIHPADRPLRRDSVLHLAAPSLSRQEGFRFDDRIARRHFSRLDTSRTAVLGFAGELPDPLVNFVRVGVGQGEVIVLATPLALTNYNLLRADGAAYAAAALAYLPSQPIVWDAIHKPLGTREGSPLRYIHETPPLAFSYYAVLIAALLFVGFRGRRWERPIPVVEAPRNQTVAFARAVARLWFEHRDDRGLAARRLRHLRKHLASLLHEPELELTPDYRDQLIRRLSIPEDAVDTLLAHSARVARTSRFGPRELVELDACLDRIYEHLP